MTARLMALATLTMLAMSACSAGKAAHSPAYVDQRKQEIAMLWTQIRDWRHDAGWKAEPSPRVPTMSVHDPVPATRCVEEPRTERCKDVCNLADNICYNAERICAIAAELGSDPWAIEKCNDAKRSCKEARDRCCGCVAREPEPAPAEEAASEDPA